MTNLEFYKGEINEYIEKNIDIYVYDAIANGFKELSKKYINNYPNNPLKFIDWLLQEHKEPIKLTKFEYDLLMSYINKGYYFKNYSELKEMRNKGYFKGITDMDMKTQEILKNCEVIDE